MPLLLLPQVSLAVELSCLPPSQKQFGKTYFRKCSSPYGLRRLRGWVTHGSRWFMAPMQVQCRGPEIAGSFSALKLNYQLIPPAARPALSWNAPFVQPEDRRKLTPGSVLTSW